MRIGIVTYHHVINDGAVLQALAQQQALQRIMPEAQVEIVDFRYSIIEKRERSDVLKDFLKFRKSAIHKLRKYLAVRKFINTKLVLSPVRIVSDSLEEVSALINQRYDAVVVGSDEVWKIDYKRYSRPFPNLYWLPDPVRVIRIASAASANTLKLDKLKAADKQKAAELLQAFSLIGARDQFTFDLVRDLVPNPPLHLMPDPTFGLVLDEKVYESVRQKIKHAGVDLDRPAVLFSLSSNIGQLRALSSALFKQLEASGVQVVSIGQFNAYCHVNLTGKLDPLEWAHVYRFFDYCITDRFHSTIFSIRNQTNFVSVDASSKYTSAWKGKIHDLLTRTGMLDHHLNLKQYTTDTAVEKILDLRTSGQRQDLRKKLKAVDAELVVSYEAFAQRIKALLKP